MKFQVIHEDGLWVTDINEDSNTLGTSYLYKYKSQFHAERINYTQVKIEGIQKEISIYDKGILYAMEIETIEDMYWSIYVLPGLGIHVYSDQHLTEYCYTIPYKNKINITGRSFIDSNYVYTLEEDTSKYIGYDLYHYMFNYYPLFLSPIRNVLFGKITNPDGVLVRRTKEIYSQIIGILNVNARVYIKQKDFSTVPSTNNIARYQLVNDMGWINVVNQNSHNVSIQGYIPPNETEFEMTIIDLQKTCFVSDSREKESIKKMCIICTNDEPGCVFIHEGTGHAVCCFNCGKRIMEMKMKCPMCRQQIEKLVQLF